MINYTLEPVKIFPTDNGDVLHGMKKSADTFLGFGEVYFSEVLFRSIKAWKKHNEMTMNLLVPIGEIKFVISDNVNSKNPKFEEVTLSKENYKRLTIPPGMWFGFKGLSEAKSLLVNIADIEHNPKEVEQEHFKNINYDWSN